MAVTISGKAAPTPLGTQSFRLSPIVTIVPGLGTLLDGLVDASEIGGEKRRHIARLIVEGRAFGQQSQYFGRAAHGG